jgi:hypothetical protein
VGNRVNIDQLLDSLAEHDPNPFHVMTQVERKRRAARHRLYVASGGLAVVAAAIAVIAALPSINFGGPMTSSSSAAGAAAEPNPGRAAGPATAPVNGASSFGGSAASCAAMPLRQAIAMAVQHGGSVIVGYGTQTGRSVPGNLAQGGAPAYYAVTLRSVRTLAGPAVAPGSTAWVPGAAAGTAASGTGSSGGTASSGGTVSTPESEALWAPDGELFAIVSPSTAGSPRGPVLRSAPVINGNVIFSSYGCWDVTGLPATPYGGSSAQVLGPAHPNGSSVRPAALPGESLSQVPLTAVETVASGR